MRLFTKTNLFLENIHKTLMNEVDKNKWIGEAYFMRAFYHFMLFRYMALSLC